jgi:hypothetical protein
MAAPPQLPALSEPARQEHHVGKVVFVLLVTPDLAAAKTFYAGPFGWTFRDIPFGETVYSEAYLDGRPVAGLFQKPTKAGEHRQPAWLGFISASDVDATRKTALQHGAKVLFEPHDIPNIGRDAALADPQGAVFAVLASSSGDPPDVLGDTGEWSWSSLITSDYDPAGFHPTGCGFPALPVRRERERSVEDAGSPCRCDGSITVTAESQYFVVLEACEINAPTAPSRSAMVLR